MLPVASKAGGEVVATGVDVCKTPPLMVPVAYPNTSSLSLAQKTAPTVFIEYLAVVILPSILPVSSGDEAGTGGGVVSGTVKGPVQFLQGSSKVYASGQPVVYLGCTTGQNGTAPNVMGKVVAVTQNKVFTAP